MQVSHNAYFRRSTAMASSSYPQIEQQTRLPREEKHVPAYGDPGDGDDRSSLSSDDAQTGVKRVEAVSLTWTKWGLIAAYVG